jgi:VanZ family protein
MPRRAGRFARLCLLCYAFLILGLSSIPASDIPVQLFWGADKLVHFAVYAGLGALALIAIWRGDMRARVALSLVALLGLAFGVIDELYQGTVPGRDSDWADVIADFAGVCFGAWGAIVVYSRRGNSCR